ncbi:unnamed protein product [Schistocephalus solidus]|uniref:Reverse transcriptase domain-containing protein n=1 Tax=Schistocephalus solidus TaxID=70667 RepID=A0A183S9F2_SCHSO|nr:unnamed protein product [Schistocephalus solidus]
MQRNRVKGLIVRTRQAFEVDLLNRATVNSKLFYGYLRQNTWSKDPIPRLTTTEGIDLTEDGAKADHLSEFFQSVFTKETRYDHPTDGFEVKTIFETVHFTGTTVLKELLWLKESKSPGVGDVPAKLLKELTKELAKPLSTLFKTSFQTGSLPADWKSAWITPLYKGGSRVSTNNFRPVSLTSVCCKIMEKIIKQQLIQLLEHSNLQSEVQHGFRRVYINDCANELNCDIAIFADDLKHWRVIQTAADEENLQANLNRLQKWSNDWLLPFNESKCNSIRVGKSNPSNHTVNSLNGIPLKEVDAQTDLRVRITPSLKYFLHCAEVAKSATSILYLVKQAFAAFITDCFAKVFGTFVWPQLKSSIQAWRPCAAKDINILEKVQRQATKLVLGHGS